MARRKKKSFNEEITEEVSIPRGVLMALCYVAENLTESTKSITGPRYEIDFVDIESLRGRPLRFQIDCDDEFVVFNLLKAGDSD